MHEDHEHAWREDDVLSKFFKPSCHLMAARRSGVSGSLRQGIGKALSMMDDVPLPAEYHSTMPQ
ncbi:hypothetical protein [Paraburkholderia sp. BL6669N2]|uniref:hypothetical protein n=1 Tax=Paraburkholderia sp. BL6669N2 TaxID=1938807 RepID=UPI000E2222FB|nr:hypothetical protein [Paraburkholderia sp. BL6669N2]